MGARRRGWRFAAVAEDRDNKGGDSGRGFWSRWIVMRLPSPFSLLNSPARVGGEIGGLEVTRWGLFLRRGVPLFSVLLFGQSLFCSWKLNPPIILPPLYLLVFHHPERERESGEGVSFTVESFGHLDPIRGI